MRIDVLEKKGRKEEGKMMEKKGRKEEREGREPERCGRLRNFAPKEGQHLRKKIT